MGTLLSWLYSGTHKANGSCNLIIILPGNYKATHKNGIFMINMNINIFMITYCLTCTHAWEAYRADCLLGEFDVIPSKSSCKAVTLAEETESLAAG